MSSSSFRAALPAKRRVKGSPAPEGMRLTLTGLGGSPPFFSEAGSRPMVAAMARVWGTT